MEPEPPFLEQDGVTLNRNAVRKEVTDAFCQLLRYVLVYPRRGFQHL